MEGRIVLEAISFLGGYVPLLSAHFFAMGVYLINHHSWR